MGESKIVQALIYDTKRNIEKYNGIILYVLFDDGSMKAFSIENEEPEIIFKLKEMPIRKILKNNRNDGLICLCSPESCKFLYLTNEFLRSFEPLKLYVIQGVIT